MGSEREEKEEGERRERGGRRGRRKRRERGGREEGERREEEEKEERREEEEKGERREEEEEKGERREEEEERRGREKFTYHFSCKYMTWCNSSNLAMHELWNFCNNLYSEINTFFWLLTNTTCSIFYHYHFIPLYFFTTSHVRIHIRYYKSCGLCLNVQLNQRFVS